MKILGNDVYIQRGENWTIDFEVKNDDGDPYMILKSIQNPYIAITVTAARYEQQGDFRKTYWLDLTDESFKKFISTEALYLGGFTIEEAIAYYGVDNGGKMVLDEGDDFDVMNYLFYTDPDSDGNRIYKYVSDYTVVNGVVTSETWSEYTFRIVKEFNTKSWMEQCYLYDIKLLAGETVKEHVATLLNMSLSGVNDWSDETTLMYINSISDDKVRLEMLRIYDSGIPLMPDYDTKSLILQPSTIYVSSNIQGGVR